MTTAKAQITFTAAGTVFLAKIDCYLTGYHPRTFTIYFYKSIEPCDGVSLLRAGLALFLQINYRLPF